MSKSNDQSDVTPAGQDGIAKPQPVPTIPATPPTGDDKQPPQSQFGPLYVE